MRKSKDLEQFKNVLPYASEIFGVYRPMLGWRSKRLLLRFVKGFDLDIGKLKNLAFHNISVDAKLSLVEPAARRGEREPILKVERINPGSEARSPGLRGSFLLEQIAAKLPDESELEANDWNEFLNVDAINTLLNRNVAREITKVYSSAEFQSEFGQDANQALRMQVADESRIARMVLDLNKNKELKKLSDLFYGRATLGKAIAQISKYKDPFEYIDPHKDLDRVSLSPIGIVHLFRQYFFEFDTFLGTPVEHVWLSPGSQVELIETTTRRRYVEETFESESSLTMKTEAASSESDELSDAVKQDNRSDTKFGVNAKVEQGWVGGSAQASSSINLDKTQGQARENTHKRMRQQSDKLSSEIRKSFKSTFKTVTEITDTSSKRHLLANTTDKLINYEMRRKMRQVGVQVQDIGTYLCWQTYVDDPGRQLGVSEMVHVADSPELGNIPPPESVPNPKTTVSDAPISIPFEPRTGDTNSNDMDEVYRNGKEVNTDFNEGDPERVRYKFGPYQATCPESGFEYDHIEFDYQNNDIRCKVYNRNDEGPGKISFKVKVTHVNFRNVSPLQIIAKIYWRPTQEALDAVAAQNAHNIKNYNAATQLEFKRAFVAAAQERINLASQVQSRPYSTLREEERTVVYRSLIQDMLTRDLPLTDDRTRHAVSEILNSIFDIDKMLYFVAPEWWRPRLHRSGQQLGDDGAGGEGNSPVAQGSLTKSVFSYAKANNFLTLSEATSEIDDEHIVTWGGGTGRFDNYYITDSSDLAPMGASLGWLLQLDGDDMRNAFLNAPWVKAVIPIRPGKEKAAFNWLARLEVEGTEGLDDLYSAPPSELDQIPHSGSGPTLKDAILHLCTEIEAKHKASNEVGLFPKEEINDDNKVAATPVDKVYEHGFYSIQGGFKIDPSEPFEVFDQWIEILPTDQIVPVEVTYDPITGRQIV